MINEDFLVCELASGVFHSGFRSDPCVLSIGQLVAERGNRVSFLVHLSSQLIHHCFRPLSLRSETTGDPQPGKHPAQEQSCPETDSEGDDVNE